MALRQLCGTVLSDCTSMVWGEAVKEQLLEVMANALTSYDTIPRALDFIILLLKLIQVSGRFRGSIWTAY